MPRILVVDDDPGLLRLVARILEEAGYEVEAVADSADVMQAARSVQPFELVVTNRRVSSPDSADPLEALRRLYGDVPVLHLSRPSSGAVTPAYSRREGDESRGFEGFTAEELVSRVQRLVGPGRG